MNELPDPWEELPVDPNEQRELTRIHMNTLLHDDKGDGMRTYYWVHVRNKETRTHVYIQIGMAPFSKRMKALAVFFVTGSFTGVISGSEMRKLPLSTICSIYEERQGDDSILLNRVSVLGTGPVDPLRPLPKIGKSKDADFYALVAIQFEGIQSKFPDDNVAKRMAKLNEVPLSTIQRWIAKSRQLNLLAPARWVK